MRINWDGETSGYAENPDNWVFSLKIGYIDSLKWGKKKSANGCLRRYIYLLTNKTLIPYMYLPTGGKI